MKMVIDHLQKRNIQNIFYFDLEKPDHYELCNKSDEEKIKYILAKTKSSRRLAEDLDGFLFENSIYCYLRKQINTKDIHFWRTTTKQEVDFILDLDPIKSFEVKIQYHRNATKNLLTFGKQYKESELYFVTLDKKERIKNLRQIYPWELEKILDSKRIKNSF
jgi:hypothetical protein